MKDKKMTTMITMMIIGMVMTLVVAQTTSPVPFTTCYGRCFFFCAIVPQNMCTCTSTCLKQCLDIPPSSTTMAIDEHALNHQNLGYCKLGCATSLCANISKLHNPDAENMGRCVDSCSVKCNLSYL
ncbi:thionin-like protein 2 [Rutidosis leptorrhynchoides]|uniref:thionin-like protein 2 n=1 Tax=Rutidosis leptorrhynchoides TaxID=125765 RepID=UPI003A99345C